MCTVSLSHVYGQQGVKLKTSFWLYYTDGSYATFVTLCLVHILSIQCFDIVC